MGPDRSDASLRFADPLTRLWRFADEIFVRCPRCDRRAVVFPSAATRDQRHSSLHRRLSCLQCGYQADWTAPRVGNGWRVPEASGPDDPYFGRPLWSQVECCGGHILWAYNLEHLNLLEAYLAARIRERGEYKGTMSLIERLPAWLKAARHREESLRAVRRLRESIQ